MYTKITQQVKKAAIRNEKRTFWLIKNKKLGFYVTG